MRSNQARPLAVPIPRRTDEVLKERRRPGGPRLELGMELAGDEPGMVGQLEDLDELTLQVGAGDNEARLGHPLPVQVVDLVAVPMPLEHDALAVGLVRARSI